MFTYVNCENGEEYRLIIFPSGKWHAQYPSPRGTRLINSLEEFQQIFQCSDEDLEIIKLKHGTPRDLRIKGTIQIGFIASRRMTFSSDD